jgi:hypothetical protein
VLTDPLERQVSGDRTDEVDAVATTAPVLDVVLSPGDSLYLPRGWLHSAAALGEQSVHLTLGVRAMTRYVLVEELLGLATEEESLRAGFPLGLDVTDPDQLGPHLDTTVAALTSWLAAADAPTVAGRLRERVWRSSRPAPIRPLAQITAMAGLDAHTVLAPRGNLRWRLTAGESGSVVLKLVDRTITVPAHCEPALRALLVGPSIRVGDLPELPAADQVTLARRMLREAVVVPAEKA